MNDDSSLIAFSDSKSAEFYGFGYIDISGPLLEAERKGVRVRWKGDSHLNIDGQKIFGEAILKWMGINIVPTTNAMTE